MTEAAPLLVGLRIQASKENQKLWRPAKYNIATKTGGVMEVSGFLHKGIGIHKHPEDCGCTPKGVEAWAVSHIGSGHLVFHTKGGFGIAVEIATLLASLGDWDFKGLRGFSNVSPDLMEKTKMLYQMFSQYCFIPSDDPGPNEPMADTIAKAQLN